MPEGDSLARIAEEVAACRACPRLVEWREKVATEKRAAFRDETYWGRGVPGFGDPNAVVLVVGLAPAAHGANRTGRMFTGDRSGDFLYRSMWRTGFANQATSHHIDDGLELTGAYITAPVKCAPPANKPTREERANCRGFLVRELALLPNVKVVIALGRIAYETVTSEFGLRPRPPFGHGADIALGDGRTMLCSYHVSQQNTFTGRLTEEMFDGIWLRARELAGLETYTPG